jgi:hypothetical protein
MLSGTWLESLPATGRRANIHGCIVRDKFNENWQSLLSSWM